MWNYHYQENPNVKSTTKSTKVRRRIVLDLNATTNTIHLY